MIVNEDRDTHTKKCINEKPYINYYLDNNTDTYYECYKSCRECDFQGNETYNNCKKCHNSVDPTSWDQVNYYKIPNDEINCYTKEEVGELSIYKNYYFDDIDREIKNVMKVVQHVTMEGMMKIQNVKHVPKDMFLLNYQII